MNTIVVGGGQAGITLSYFLQQHNVEHLVLERDRAFSAWHNRWDHFKFNTANWMNSLPGMQSDFASHKKWYDIATRREALKDFAAYVQSVNPPLQEGVTVHKIQEQDHSWLIETDRDQYCASNVAICTGYNARGFIPNFAQQLPKSVIQLHSSDYRNPSQITTPNVLIVGSGSSGVQICEDLAQSSKFDKIIFSTSGNAVVPWSILGIPIGALSRLFPVFEVRRHSWLGKHFARQWQGGDPAMAPSPQRLSKKYGVELVERVRDVHENEIVCIDKKTLPTEDLTIIWCTGFLPDFSFIQVTHPQNVFDETGPIHDRGIVTSTSGLFFVGLKFQHTVGSHLLRGVGRDAEYIAQKIAERNHPNEQSV